MTYEPVFPQASGGGEQVPLTRKELRERERTAQHSKTEHGKTRHNSAHTKAAQAAAVQQRATRSVEAPIATVFDDLFTPRSGAVPVVDQSALPVPIAEPAALPSRRSRRASGSDGIHVAAEVDLGVPATVPVPVPAPVPVLPVNTTTTDAAVANQAVVATPSVVTTRTVVMSDVAVARVRKVRPTAVKSKRIRVSPSALSPSGPPRRKAKRLASKALSLVAMLFAGALLVGVTVPSNAFVDSGNTTALAAAPDADVAQLATDSRPTQSLAVSDEVIADVDKRDGVSVISYAEVLALQYAGVSREYRATAGAIRWPFPYEVPITDGFGDRIGGFHKGTDFAAASGTPIYAVADGVVTLIQADYSGYGYHAIISHTINGQQVESLYAHMITDSSPLVVGEAIKVGDFIGLVGETGIAYGAHLHFEIHLDDVPVDPFVWLTANAVN